MFERGGFNAVIGNPPFLGGWRQNEAFGSAYRDYLVEYLANGRRGVRGTADLVAYFALRAAGLVNGRGQLGLIATNTLSQADTRVVGLDQIVGSGAIIRRSIKSESWPSRTASLAALVASGLGR